MYRNDLLNRYRDKLIANHGRSIIRALNEKTRLSSVGDSRSVSVKDLGNYTNSKTGAPDIGSTHLRVTEKDGEIEDFLLTLRQYIYNPIDISTKKSSAQNQLSFANTYLALSPDRFYLQDDEEGKEIWPVTFPAVSMNDSTDKISVTFNKDGFVHSSLSGKSDGNGRVSASEPNLVFAEATPVLRNEGFCEDGTAIEECGSGGGGSGGGSGGGDNDDPYCTEIDGDGGYTGGPTNGIQTYFAIKAIRLWATGDGDGASELQMFIAQNDDYSRCFPRYYKYRLDEIYSYDPTKGADTYNTVNYGADGSAYILPDVDHDDITYNIDDRFPLFDLNRRPGPWRLVFSDDDKDYNEFSRRRASDFAQDIQTYDMATGTWKEVYTGFSTDRKTSGSSDDPIRESAVRRITESNMERLVDIYNDHKTTKSYPGGSFSYTFSLVRY